MADTVLNATIHEDRRLIIDLPPDAPLGDVQVVIRPKRELTREEARAILLAAGILSTVHRVPEGAKPLSPEELLEYGKLPPGARPSEELIDEDRGEY